ncbi:MAG: hypothetical protein ACP5M9_02185 [Candidatus Micrarchaeia archaeon]
MLASNIAGLKPTDIKKVGTKTEERYRVAYEVDGISVKSFFSSMKIVV